MAAELGFTRLRVFARALWKTGIVAWVTVAAISFITGSYGQPRGIYPLTLYCVILVAVGLALDLAAWIGEGFAENAKR